MSRVRQRSRSNEPDWKVVVATFGIIFLVPCIIASVIYYYSYRKSYPDKENGQRVFDLSSLWVPLAKGAIALGLSAALLSFSFSHMIEGRSVVWGLVFVLTAALALAAVFYVVPRYWAATYFGLAIDVDRDLVVFRKDMANYGIGDFLTGRAVWEIGDLEAVPLSAVQRITREAGKYFYLHGAFGSRGVRFSNKQKRDEGIAAIEYARGRRLSTGEFAQ